MLYNWESQTKACKVKHIAMRSRDRPMDSSSASAAPCATTRVSNPDEGNILEEVVRRKDNPPTSFGCLRLGAISESALERAYNGFYLTT